MLMRQAHYTVCAKGVIPGTHGFAFSAASPGWEVSHLREIESICGYKPTRTLERELAQAIGAGQDIAPIVAKAPSVLQYRRTMNGLHVVSRVTYLGMADQRRLGNLFAHSLYVRDAVDVDGLRPADLWGAPFWCERQGELAELPLVDPTMAPPAFSTDELLEFARAPERREQAVRVLSAILQSLLEDPRQRRVLIVDEPSHVIRWIALASHILPPVLVRDLTFTTYIADPGSAPDCVVVGTRPDAPGLQLQSPSVRFGYWLLSFATSEFTNEVPIQDYVVRMVDATDFRSLGCSEGFLAWADAAILETPILRGHLDELVRLHWWLTTPTCSGTTFEEILAICSSLLIPNGSPLVDLAWSALAGAPTGDRFVAATRLAAAQAAAGPARAEAARLSWWRTAGAPLADCGADQLRKITESMSRARLDLGFFGAELRAPAKGLLASALMETGRGWQDALTLLVFLATHGFVRDTDGIGSQDFLDRMFARPDAINVTAEVTRVLGAPNVPQMLADEWTQRAENWLRTDQHGPKRLRELLATDDDVRRTLEAWSRGNRCFNLFAMTRQEAPNPVLSMLLPEIALAAKSMNAPEGAAEEALNAAFARHPGPLSSDEARTIAKALGGDLLGRCTFGPMVNEAVKQVSPNRAEPQPARPPQSSGEPAAPKPRPGPGGFRETLNGIKRAVRGQAPAHRPPKK